MGCGDGFEVGDYVYFGLIEGHCSYGDGVGCIAPKLGWHHSLNACLGRRINQGLLLGKTACPNGQHDCIDAFEG